MLFEMGLEGLFGSRAFCKQTNNISVPSPSQWSPVRLFWKPDFISLIVGSMRTLPVRDLKTS